MLPPPASSRPVSDGFGLMPLVLPKMLVCHYSCWQSLRAGVIKVIEV